MACAGGRAAREPRAQQGVGLRGELPKTQIGNDQQILEHFALRMAAADPWQVSKRSYELCAAVRSSPRLSAAEGAQTAHATRRQATFAHQVLQPGNAAPQTCFVAGPSFGKGGVQIGKSEARPREMTARMGCHLGPGFVERRRGVSKSASATETTPKSARLSIGADCATDGLMMLST